MSQDIEQLWALRGLDEEAHGMRVELARFPGLRQELEQRRASERARRDAVKARLAELKRQLGTLDIEAKALVEQERKFQTQLPAVKKNEEYQALLHEIEGAKGKRSDVETQILMRMEEEQERQRDLQDAERALQTAEQELADRGRTIDAAEGEQKERLAGLEARRAEMLVLLSAPVRSRYERVHASRDGRAVVPIQKGACGGCFRGQPPHVLQEARRGDRVLYCDGCGRLLVWPPGEP
jgi:hypothetical protein